MPLETGAHALRSQWRIAPASPTAHTSVLALPHTARRAVPVQMERDHALPSQCRILPFASTAQTSVLALPHTAERGVSLPPLGTEDHPLPSQCRVVPAS